MARKKAPKRKAWRPPRKIIRAKKKPEPAKPRKPPIKRKHKPKPVIEKALPAPMQEVEMADIAVGDWVRQVTHPGDEQAVKVPMLVIEVSDDGYAVVEYEGMDNSPSHKMPLGQLAILDQAALKKEADDKSKAAKDAAKDKEEAAAKAKAPEMKHEEIKPASKPAR